MKCPKCGQIARNNREFCALCGTPLKKERRVGPLVALIVALALAGLALVVLLRPAPAGEESAPTVPPTAEPVDAPQPAADPGGPAPLWTDAAEIYAGRTYALALCRDGTVRLLGESASPEFGFDLFDWSGIVQILPEDYFIAGLTADGRVRLTGEAADYAAAAQWTDMARLYYSAETLFGLTTDGRVFAAGPHAETYDFSLWNVEKLIPSYADTLAVTQDGKAHVLRRLDMLADAEGMTGIADVQVNSDYALYLMEDGTVRPADSYRYYLETYGWDDPFADWSDVRELHLGVWWAVGLTADGRVLSAPCVAGESAPDTADWRGVRRLVFDGERGIAFGVTEEGRVLLSPVWDGMYPAVTAWENVVELQENEHYIVGLTADGRVLLSADADAPAELDVSGWTGVVSVALGRDYLLGLTADGSVLLAGSVS